MSRRTRQSRRKKRGQPENSLAAFSDIAFLLIIFFIIAANLTKPSGMVTDIPSAEEGDDSEQEMPTVQLDGRSILFNEKPLGSFDELDEKLLALDFPSMEDASDRIVQLEAKDDVAYQDYYQAMLAISNAGGQVTIVQKSDEGEKKGGGG